jgi:Electron transfer DM13
MKTPLIAAAAATIIVFTAGSLALSGLSAGTSSARADTIPTKLIDPADLIAAPRNQVAQTQTPAPAQAPVAATAATKVLSEGIFRDGTPGHRGTGKVTLVSSNNQVQLQLTGFKITPGPDLKIWLVSKDDIKKERDVTSSKYLEVAALKSPSGDQTYTLPANVDLSQYKSAVIWCKTFGVLFSAASLKPPA